MNCIRTLFLTGALALAAAASALAQDSQLPIYLNTAYSFEERATDLVSRLTLLRGARDGPGVPPHA